MFWVPRWGRHFTASLNTVLSWSNADKAKPGLDLGGDGFRRLAGVHAAAARSAFPASHSSPVSNHVEHSQQDDGHDR
jgi:hypothetical protein